MWWRRHSGPYSAHMGINDLTAAIIRCVIYVRISLDKHGVANQLTDLRIGRGFRREVDPEAVKIDWSEHASFPGRPSPG
jgi:hypothetical protein